MAVIDVNYQNAFLTLEWDSIRTTVPGKLPKILSWTEWCHAEPAIVHLPCGEHLEVDRGVVQGDPIESVYCVLVISDVLDLVRERSSGKGICTVDVWYMDDGQFFGDLQDVAEVLRTLDTLSAEVGATR